MYIAITTDLLNLGSSSPLNLLSFLMVFGEYSLSLLNKTHNQITHCSNFLGQLKHMTVHSLFFKQFKLEQLAYQKSIEKSG